MISRSEVNRHLIDRGMLTIEEQCDPSPLEGFMAHSAVISLQSLEQWCRMERETYLYLKCASDLHLYEMTPARYEEILGILAWLHQFHANIRQVINSELLTDPQISETIDTSNDEEGHYQ